MGGARAWGPKGRLECRQRADGKLPPTAQRETFQNMEGLFFFTRPASTGQRDAKWINT